MKINRSSWHYRWFKFVYEKLNSGDFKYDEPRTLCAYFWRFLFNSALALFWLCVAAGAASVIPLCVYEWLLWHSAPALTILQLLMWLIITVAGVFVVLGGCVFAFSVAPEKVAEKVKYGETLNTAELCIAYVQARKRRVCPLIEYEGLR